MGKQLGPPIWRVRKSSEKLFRNPFVQFAARAFEHRLLLPSGTVKTYLHRARKELASILSSKGWGPA
jgi:hypothetical protein